MGEKSDNQSRRRFLYIISGLGLGWIGAGIYPVYKYLSPQAVPDPFDEEGKALVENIGIGDVVKPGMGKNGSYGGRGLIVFRNDEGNLKAFDSKCTHAGCNVDFQKDKIYCNCHGGTYDLEGKNIAGPPPKPLTELKVSEIDNQLYVFRPGPKSGEGA